MPGKNKKNKKSSNPGGQFAEENIDVEEELLALDSIYGDSFSCDADRRGFTVLIVPHPGEMEENHCTAELHVR